MVRSRDGVLLYGVGVGGAGTVTRGPESVTDGSGESKSHNLAYRAANTVASDPYLGV